jgi:hypothetical protein
LKYNSEFDFIDMMNEFDYEYVKFMGSTENGTYLVSIDDVDGMLYMEVPVDEYDGIVRKIVALGLKQSIILPGRISYLEDYIPQSGKSVKFKRTLSECNIVNRFLDNEFSIEGTQLDMEGFFHRSNFSDFKNGLTIKDSSIEVAHMFGSSKGLTNVTFKNCELSSLVGLVSDSEIECVTFEGCKYVAKDYSQLKSWEKRLEATCLDDIFGHNTTTVNLRDCDRTLIEVLMRLTSKSSLFFRELEINILD